MYIDLHLDTLWAMGRQQREFHELSDKGHVDLHRARNAKLLCGFFTGYPSDSVYTTEAMLAKWVRMINTPENNLKKILSTTDIEVLEEKKDKIGAVLALEGAAGIDSGLNKLYIYYEMGLRSMGLTWNEVNQFATGQSQLEGRGLTREGLDLISAMEDLGIIIDVSHLNDESFWDVVNNTNGPIIASHSNVREIAGSNRNLKLDMIEAVHSSGGVIGVNFYTGFLNNAKDEASKQDIFKMMEAIINCGNINLMAIGSDMDGASLPSDIKDITNMPNLFIEIKEKLSLNDEEMDKIKRNNVKRVMKKVWK
ncbi:MAG: membrane dipeptidase [Candidatus Heimdallarchaeota archaeon]|nr:membrane dipeptidase [Candidatus Heimdallarchaeota archaeon]